MIEADEPVPAALTPATVKITVVLRDFVTWHVAVPLVGHELPVQTYEVGESLQLAVMVALVPIAMGELGLTVGAQTGVPVAPDVTQVIVWDGGEPPTAKLVQLGFV